MANSIAYSNTDTHNTVKCVKSMIPLFSQFCSPECGDMNALCACGAAELTEPGLELRDLKPGGLRDAMLDPLGLGKPFSDTRNWVSGERSDGA